MNTTAVLLDGDTEIETITGTTRGPQINLAGPSWSISFSIWDPRHLSDERVAVIRNFISAVEEFGEDFEKYVLYLEATEAATRGIDAEPPARRQSPYVKPKLPSVPKVTVKKEVVEEKDSLVKDAVANLPDDLWD